MQTIFGPAQTDGNNYRGCQHQLRPDVADQDSPTVRSSVNTYLNMLSQQAPRSTITSHKNTLTSFIDAQDIGETLLTQIDTAVVGDFVSTMLANKSRQTIEGEVSTLANFFAYISESSPKVVEMEIWAECINQQSAVETENPEVIPENIGKVPQTAVTTYLDYLRSSAYATCTHVFAEVVIGARAQPTLVQQLNRGDLNIETGQLEVGITDTHAVGQYNLRSSRTVALPSPCIHSLETYLKYEHTIQKTENGEPLFTTQRGRLSLSYVRRRIRDTSETALQHARRKATRQDLKQQSQYRHLTPKTLWQYSLAQLLITSQ